jgi:hypothetical protein
MVHAVAHLVDTHATARNTANAASVASDNAHATTTGTTALFPPRSS